LVPDKERLSAMCSTLEDWLYDEGDEVEKKVYQAKLTELEGEFAPAETRCKEKEFRPEALSELKSCIAKFSEFAASQEEVFAHISTEDKQKVAAECAAAQTWLAETEATLTALAPTADPPVKASDISAKASSLTSVCTPIMNTPKPLPKEPDPPPAAAEPEAAPAAEAAAEPAADAAPKPDNMDVD